MRRSASTQEVAAEKIITASESRTSCLTRRVGVTALPLIGLDPQVVLIGGA
jgi:hypothetical protein